MTPRLTKSLTRGTLYILLLAVISMVSYGGVLQYTFWIDDWGYLWEAFHNVHELLKSWIHLGTSLEFFVGARLFGTEPIPWLICGIILRVGAAYAVSLATGALTKSKKAAMISGIFFAVFAVGVQAVGWPNAYVVFMAAIGICVGIYGIITYFEKGTKGDLYVGLLGIFSALALDFARAVPIIFIVLLLLYSDRSKRSYFGKKIMLWIIGGLVVTAIGVVLLEPSAFTYSVLFKSIAKYHFSAIFFYKSLQFTENIFGSIWNLCTGWITTMVQDPGNGVYHRLYSRGTFIVIMLTLCFAFYQYVIKKEKAWGLVLLCVLWLPLFYLPQWLYEPRITVDVTHRYLVIPSIGFIILISYCVSRVRNIRLQIAFIVLFLIINIVNSQKYIANALVYRSADINTIVLKAVEASVADSNKRNIFVFFGQDPVKVNVLDLSGNAHFALDEHQTTFVQRAVVTTDVSSIIKQVQLGDIMLSQVYSWDVNNSGAVVDISKSLRESIQKVL